MIQVQIHNETDFSVPKSKLVSVVHSIAADHGVRGGEISLAVVSDDSIHDLNREHLQHDYPTDVLSFLLDRVDDQIDGEVIVSADTAARTASDYGWSATEELLLYVIHGSLHLVGYDDQTEVERNAMRVKEEHYLASIGAGVSADHAARNLRDHEARM